MNAFDWLATSLSLRAKGETFFRRGMAKAKKRDHQGAIDDYTTSLGVRDTPADVTAKTLYNRAVAYVASGETKKGTDDLQAVLAMKEMLINVKTMSRQKLARMDAKANKSNG
jgi:hypothetical protein